MTLMPAFFAASAPGVRYTTLQQGIVFASFPFGAMVASPFLGAAIPTHLSQRTAMVTGLVAMAVLTLAFGAAPLVVTAADPAPLMATLVGLGLLYGMFSTAAETGAYSLLLTVARKDQQGRLIAAAEVAGSAGSMLGPFLGGAMYTAVDLFPHVDPLWAFFAPFAAVSPLPAICVVAFRSCGVAFRGEPGNGGGKESGGKESGNGDDGGGGGGGGGGDGGGDGWDACGDPELGGDRDLDAYPDHDAARSRSLTMISVDDGTTRVKGRCRLLNRTTLLTTVAVMLCSGANGTTQSTLAVRLGVSPLCFTSIQVGSTFLVGSLAYMLASFPLGRLVDRLVVNIERLEFLLCVALLTIAAVFTILGPLYIADVTQLAASVFNRPPIVIAAAALWGFADSVVIVGSLPLLLASVEDGDEEGTEATLTGIWMMAYAAGYAFGPIVGSAIMDMDDPRVCRPTDRPNASSPIFASFSSVHSSHASSPYPLPSYDANTSYSSFAATNHSGNGTANNHSGSGKGGGGGGGGNTSCIPTIPGEGRQHCFDGLATIITLAFLALATVWMACLCFDRLRRRVRRNNDDGGLRQGEATYGLINS